MKVVWLFVLLMGISVCYIELPLIRVPHKLKLSELGVQQACPKELVNK
jgi:hypothetical protein